MERLQVFFVLFGAGLLILPLMIVALRGRLSLQVHVEKKTAPLSLDQVRALTAFANEQHERIGNDMQANWSGAPEQLPAVLGRLIDTLEQEARAKGLPVDRDMLTSVVEASLRSHRIAKGGQVREALKKAA